VSGVGPPGGIASQPRRRPPSPSPETRALQEPRLGLRGGAVYLVDQDHVGEHRAGVKIKARLALVEHVGSDHVGGQEIHSALDARILGVDRAGKRPRQRRVTDPRRVPDQHVAIGKQCRMLTGGFAASELRDAGAVDVFDSVRELCERLGEMVLA
jgi:hypothetical protein